MEKPTAYLQEIRTDLFVKTGTTISESTICTLLQRNNFSRKKLHTFAKQRKDELRSSFLTMKFSPPDMMVFVDETGSDKRDVMRRYGYALRGQRATPITLLHRRNRVNSVAAMEWSSLCPQYDMIFKW